MMAIAVLAVVASVALWRKFVGAKHGRSGVVVAACACAGLSFVTVAAKCRISVGVDAVAVRRRSMAAWTRTLQPVAGVEERRPRRRVAGDASRRRSRTIPTRARCSDSDCWTVEISRKVSPSSGPSSGSGRRTSTPFWRTAESRTRSSAVSSTRTRSSNTVNTSHDEADQSTAWTNYGIALAATGDSGEAVTAFSRAAALEPGSANAHRNLANALLDRGDFDGAAREASRSRSPVARRPGRCGNPRTRAGGPAWRPRADISLTLDRLRLPTSSPCRSVPVPLRSGIGSAHDARFHEVHAGAGVLRSGSGVSAFVLVDGSGAVVQPGPDARLQPGAGARRPVDRVHRAQRPSGRARRAGARAERWPNTRPNTIAFTSTCAPCSWPPRRRAPGPIRRR